MALHYRTRGFVVKKTDIGEADRIFTVFTEDFGKIKILGKAIRKIASKLRGGLDINSFSELEFIQGKTFKTLTDAVIIDKFLGIKKDQLRLRIASEISKNIDSLLIKEEKDEAIFQLLKTTYLKLDKSGVRMLYFYFLWNFFDILGYRPELYRCIVCQKNIMPKSIYFSSADGGVVCGSCGRNKEGVKMVNSDVIKILRLILKKSWDTLVNLKVLPLSTKLLKDVSYDYYFYLLSIHSSDSDIIKNKTI